ncbi:MAG: ROK family protein [Planctomycetes bacterium]|nr:ROK family protein [Planctomycetota bacterium]
MIGVDFGGTRIKAGVVKDGVVTREVVANTPRTPAAIFAAISKLVKSLKREPESVGVAIPGEVDEHGHCYQLPNVKGFEGIAIARELSKRLGCPVSVENDATAAALAERRFGHGLHVRSFLLVTLGTGIGGGLCIDGAVRRGRRGFGGEIGHVLVEAGKDAWPCGCGLKGCMEAYTGTAGLIRKFRSLGGKANEILDIAKNARHGEKAGVKTFQHYGHYLGSGLATIQNVLDLDALVFTGGIAASFDLLEPSLRAGMKARAFAPPLADIPFLRSELGEQAGVVGAALLPQIMINE